MKLRIRGDSLRLRLTQTEVKKIAEGASVTETTHFLDGMHLHYILAPEEKLTTINARFKNHEILVGVPMKIAQDWAKSKNVALKHEESNFSVLIEKDFTCLKERQNENEDETDLFENPNSTTGHCG